MNAAPDLHPLAEAVLEEFDEGEGGAVILDRDAESRLDAELAKYFARDDLLVAVESLIAVAAHVEQSLKSPEVAGKIYALAVKATPHMLVKARQTSERTMDAVNERKAAFTKFTGAESAAKKAPAIGGKVPDRAVPIARLSVPSRFR